MKWALSTYISFCFLSSLPWRTNSCADTWDRKRQEEIRVWFKPSSISDDKRDRREQERCEKTKAWPRQLPCVGLGLLIQHGHSQKFQEAVFRWKRWEKMMLSVRSGRRHTGRVLCLKVKEIKIISFGFGDCVLLLFLPAVWRGLMAFPLGLDAKWFYKIILHLTDLVFWVRMMKALRDGLQKILHPDPPPKKNNKPNTKTKTIYKNPHKSQAKAA